MQLRGSVTAVLAGSVYVCLVNVLPSRAESQLAAGIFDNAPLFSSKALSNLANTGAAGADVGKASDDPFRDMALLRPSFEALVPLQNSAGLDASVSGLQAYSPTTGSFAHGPTALPAESGINYTFSPFVGFLNLGSGAGAQATGGSSGSIAFPIGHSFGLLSDFTTASISGHGFYAGGTNFYWRDPGLGLVGADIHGGHYAAFGGKNFIRGGPSVEGYYGRFTPFASVGAFSIQSLTTRGYASVGTAYYPTDNVQLSVAVADYGGYSSVRGGVEYLLPKSAMSFNGVRTTVGLSGFVGNHGTSGLMAKLKFLAGPPSTNNKTLIERRRQDDPVAFDSFNDVGILRIIEGNSRAFGQIGQIAPHQRVCQVGELITSGCQCVAPNFLIGNQCS